VIQVRPPIPNQDDAFFFEGAAEGRLLIQRCADCGTVRHPPAPMCARCGSLVADSIESTGRGTIHSWILSRHPSQPDAEPRVVVLVDLEEGTRLVSNLVDVPLDAVETGQAVEVCFVTYDTGEGTTLALPQFRLADGGAR
jgi:uncharacterized OB-fold protein